MSDHAPNTDGHHHDGFRLRWWMWILLVLVIVFSAIFGMRQHGWTRYQAVQADLKAKGYATTAVELVAKAPPVDKDRQERLWRAMEVMKNHPWAEWQGGTIFERLREKAENDPDRLKISRNLLDGAIDMENLESVLDEGPVELSVFGWIERDPGRLAKKTLWELATSRIPLLLVSRGCAHWWGSQAIAATNPTTALKRLDCWNKSLEKPGTLIDAMIGLAVGEIRDQVYLWLAVRGRLPAQQQIDWMTEDPQQVRWVADGLAGERCLWWEPMSHSNVAEAFEFTRFAVVSDMTDHLYPAKFHEIARGIQAIGDMEAELKGTPRPTPVPPAPFGFNYISRIAFPSLGECSITAHQSAFRHRQSRIAGVIASHYRTNPNLPASRNDLAAWLPTGYLEAKTPDNPAIQYERLSPGRFRIGIDPLAKPPSIPASRWGPTYTSTIGQQPDREPVKDCRWSLEIDLDAILIPPPPPKPRALKPANP